MMTSTRKLVIGMISIFAVIGIIFIGLSVLSHQESEGSKRSDFPVLQPSPLYSLNENVSFSKQIEMSEIVVDATVVEVNPLETFEYIPEPGSHEQAILDKIGKSAFEIPMKKIVLKANDYIKGNAGETFVMPIVSVNLDSAPDFKAGDRFVLTLHKYVNGGYTNVFPVSSYFFVADDEKVYPAGDETPTAGFSGMSLNQFKTEIRTTKS